MCAGLLSNFHVYKNHLEICGSADSYWINSGIDPRDYFEWIPRYNDTDTGLN